MPMKQLNVWRKHLPGVLFANLFGPTEVTDICAYYILDRSFQDDESLPIGKPCDNCALELIPAEGDNTQTELCVRGSIVAMGHYNNPKKLPRRLCKTQTTHAILKLYIKPAT